MKTQVFLPKEKEGISLLIIHAWNGSLLNERFWLCFVGIVKVDFFLFGGFKFFLCLMIVSEEKEAWVLIVGFGYWWWWCVGSWCGCWSVKMESYWLPCWVSFLLESFFGVECMWFKCLMDVFDVSGCLTNSILRFLSCAVVLVPYPLRGVVLLFILPVLMGWYVKSIHWQETCWGSSKRPQRQYPLCLFQQVQ